MVKMSLWLNSLMSMVSMLLKPSIIIMIKIINLLIYILIVDSTNGETTHLTTCFLSAGPLRPDPSEKLVLWFLIQPSHSSPLQTSCSSIAIVVSYPNNLILDYFYPLTVVIHFWLASSRYKNHVSSKRNISSHTPLYVYT